MVAKHELDWMGVFARDADGVHEVMVLLVEPLVERQSLVFAVQGSVRHVEAEVFCYDADGDVPGHFEGVRKIVHSHSPWDLPVVHPGRKRQADKVQKHIVKDTTFDSSDDLLSPAYWIKFPWPRVVLLNFELLKEFPLTPVYHPKGTIQNQNEGSTQSTNISNKELSFSKLITLRHIETISRLFF